MIPFSLNRVLTRFKISIRTIILHINKQTTNRNAFLLGSSVLPFDSSSSRSQASILFARLLPFIFISLDYIPTIYTGTTLPSSSSSHNLHTFRLSFIQHLLSSPSSQRLNLAIVFNSVPFPFCFTYFALPCLNE